MPAMADSDIVISESFIGRTWEFVMSFLHPITAFIAQVAGSGWFGFALVFMIFFMVHLIRAGARSKQVHVYADGLRFIGFWGGIVCGGYLVLLTAEYLLMPPLVLALYVVGNSLFGTSEPTVGEFINFMLGSSPYRAKFIADVADFYGTSHLLLPLGFRAAGLVTIAFGSMYVVSRAIGRSRQTSTL
jgi:hypothetical protein